MIPLTLVFFALGLVAGALRRGGLALALALFGGFLVTFGQAPPEFEGGLYATIVVFVGVRLAQSYARSHEPEALAAARHRLAGRPIYRERESPLEPAAPPDEHEDDHRFDETEAATTRTRSRPSCEGRRRE